MHSARRLSTGSPSVSRLPAWLVFALFAAMLTEPQAAETGTQPDWGKACDAAQTALLDGTARLPDLVARATAVKPTTAQDALFKLYVLLRAGMFGDAVRAVAELHALAPDLHNGVIESIYGYACDRLQAWDVAQAMIEEFGANISRVDADGRLLRHREESGWSVERIDAWLAARPPGIDGFWALERVRYNARHGRASALLPQFAEPVRQQPGDMAAAILYLDAVREARLLGNPRPDLAWFTDMVKPPRTTDVAKLAGRCQDLDEWVAAAVLWRRAVDTPLTDAEAGELGKNLPRVLPEAKRRAEFEAGVRERLAQCLLKLGRNAEAQTWMVQADDIRKAQGLGHDAFSAGATQRASGQRVIEGRIRDEEKRSENDPEYWLERARYYEGRKEPKDEEKALLKALALTSLQSSPDHPADGHAEMRGWMLGVYAGFLQREKRTADVLALLRRELQEAPPLAKSAEQAARLLSAELMEEKSPDDPVLWGWLARRPRWGYTEEAVLRGVLEGAPHDGLDPYFRRAEALAKGADPSRSVTLGWIMDRMGFAKRSLPLLETAFANAQDKEMKGRAAFTLFEACLETGDWRRAEEVFPDASRYLSSYEVPEWRGHLAACAARQGAKTDALRLWTAMAAANPERISDLNALVKAGLKPELVAFYREMQKQLPGSEFATRALKQLGE